MTTKQLDERAGLIRALARGMLAGGAAGAGVHALGNVNNAMPRRVEQAWANLTRGSRPQATPRPQAAPQPRVPGSSADRTWNRMVGIESQGRQFDSRGRTLTSSAGAIGAAQIMPQYGPEFARRAGVEWDERRARTDRDYNLRLGRAQYDYLVRRYNGDTERAAAAYNAGPGNLSRAERRARNSGRPQDWRSHLPGETQEYIRNAMREDVETENYLTKTDVISKAVANYGNTYPALTTEEVFYAIAESIPQNHAVMLTRLFTDLDEDNQEVMVEMMEDDQGIRQLLDFAIDKYMAIR